MADMEKIVASLSQSRTQMRSSTDHESSSRVRPPSTHQETQASSRSTLTGTYKLMHLRKSTVVAFGSLMGVSPDNSECYRIVIDEIVDGDIELMDGVRKMEVIMVANIIDWPTFRTFPCWFFLFYIAWILMVGWMFSCFGWSFVSCTTF